MKKYSALIIPLFVFWAVVFFYLISSLKLTEGIFLYTLDDPYIHMAIAKNFVLHGVWGITQYEFTSCSSSPLWTFLVSVSYFIFGVKDLIPFILNLIFASLTAVLVFQLIRKFTESKLLQSVILLFILFFSPFVSVVFTGLEHSLYSFLIILTAVYFYKILKNDFKKSNHIIFLISIMLLTSARYEGMFIAFTTFLVLLYEKKYYTGFLSLLFTCIPILIIGLISASKGWYFFPNSVLLKSGISFTDLGSFIKSIFNPQFFELLWAYKRILLLVLISGIMFFVLKKDEDTFALKPLIFVFIAATFLHINFAKLGSLMRYEMYIMVFGMALNSVLILKFINNKSKNVKHIISVLVFMTAIPFSISTFKAVTDVPVASANIYQMQYQMSRFINNYYDKKTIALNDIGVVNYYCDIQCVDMWGLANKEVAYLRKSGNYTPEKIYTINKNNSTEIAIVFSSWFEKYGGLPKNWYCSGSWRIPDNITCGSDAVTFYATDSISHKVLDKNLLEFQKELPREVEQSDKLISF